MHVNVYPSKGFLVFMRIRSSYFTLFFIFLFFGRCSEDIQLCAGGCVNVWDDAQNSTWLGRLGGPPLAHLRHRSGGVSLLCWSRVWVGFPRVCPQDRGLLQLSVRQHDHR